MAQKPAAPGVAGALAVPARQPWLSSHVGGGAGAAEGAAAAGPGHAGVALLREALQAANQAADCGPARSRCCSRCAHSLHAARLSCLPCIPILLREGESVFAFSMHASTKPAAPPPNRFICPLRPPHGRRPPGGLSTSSGSPLPFGAALPAPLRLAAVPLLVDRLLGAARKAMLTMTDELLHLRAFLRYGAVGPPPPPPAVAPGGREELTDPDGNTGASHVGCGMEPSFAADLAGVQAMGAAQMGESRSAGAAAVAGVGLPGRLLAALRLPRTGDQSTGCEGGGGDGSDGGGSGSPVSPRLLISGQWQHKHTVLLLLAQLRQVLRAAGALDEQLTAAEW